MTKLHTRITLALGHSFQREGDPDEFLEHIEHMVVPATYADGFTDAVDVFCHAAAALDLDMCSIILEALRKGRKPLGLSVEETIAAATVNAARVLGVSDEAGVIAQGRPADLLFFKADSLEALFDENGPACMATTVSGKLMRY